MNRPLAKGAITAYVARHFQETVEPMGYKAFLVAVDREACGLYKEALDRLLPSGSVEVVISAAQNDPDALARHHHTEDEEQSIRKAFRKPDGLPKILIVTEKLLTGFDAPILYAMYLDKPMRDHVLLQAIARVNRPYEDAAGRPKPAGFVLDFVGLFDKLERALAFDSQDVAGVIEGLDVLQKRFETLMGVGRATYLTISAGKRGDKAAEAILEHFRDEERRHELYRYYRELQELYEILSPDPFLRPFLDDYNELTAIYRLVRSAYEPSVGVDRSFLRKTAELVQQHTHLGVLGPPRTIYKLDARTLEALAGEDRPDTVKVFNLLRAFHDLVADQAAQNPYLIPIGERAEQIARAFQERQSNAREALRQLEELIQEYRQAEQSRQETGLTSQGFAVYWLLKREGVERADEAARQTTAAFATYPHWQRSGDQERAVRVATYRALLAVGVGAEKVGGFVERLLNVLKRALS